MSDDFIFIVVILISIIIIAGMFYEYYREKYVKENSDRYHTALEVRQYYDDLKKDCDVLFVGEYLFDTKRKFDNPNNTAMLFSEYLLKQEDKIQKTYDDIEMNRKFRYDFNEKFKDINNLPKLDKYKGLEDKLIAKIEKDFDIKINAEIDYTALYTSPKGQNSYYKNWIFNIDEVMGMLNEIKANNKEKTKYEIFRDAERAKMTAGLRYDVLKRDNFTCQYCGAISEVHGVTLHVDHIKPVIKGGLTEKDNLQTLCQTCNLGKGIKD